MHPRRLMCISDLDGTLLDSEGGVPGPVRQAVDLFRSRGGAFTVCTARGMYDARLALAGLGVDGLGAFYGGAVLGDLRTGAIVFERSLAHDIVGPLLSLLRLSGLRPQVVGRRGGTERALVESPANDAETAFVSARLNDRRLQIEDGFTAGLDAVYLLSCLDASERIRSCTEKVASMCAERARVQVTVASEAKGYLCLQILPSKCDKGTATRSLASSLQGTGRYIATFGDTASDIPMFAASDWSVAVANASREVRDSSAEVVPSNDEGGVGYKLAQLADAALASWSP